MPSGVLSTVSGSPPSATGVLHWKLLLAALVAALVLLAALQELTHQGSLPQSLWLLFPLGLAAVWLFCVFPALTLFTWAVIAAAFPWPIIGREIFLYDLFTVLLASLWLIHVMARGRMTLREPDHWVILVWGVALLSILLNLWRVSEVQDRLLHVRHLKVEFPGKTNLSALLQWSTYLLAYFFASRLANSKKKINWVLRGAFLAVLINCFYALYFWAANPLGLSRQNRTTGLLLEVQDQGYISMFFLLGILVFWSLHVVRGWRLWLLLAMAALLLLNIVFNFTRAVYLECAVGVLALMAFTRSGRLVIALGALAAFLFIVLQFVQIDRWANLFITRITTKQGAGLPLRLAIWLDALRLFRQEGGFWGIGLGNYMAYSEAVVSYVSLLRARLASAHGMYLQILAEQGIPGIVAWAVFLTAMLRYFRHQAARAQNRYGRALNTWAFTLLLVCCVDGFLYMVLLPPGYSHEYLKSGYYVWILLGLAVAYNRLPESLGTQGTEGSAAIPPTPLMKGSQTAVPFAQGDRGGSFQAADATEWAFLVATTSVVGTKTTEAVTTQSKEAPHSVGANPDASGPAISQASHR